MRCAFWRRAHAAEDIQEMGQAVQEAGGRLPARCFEGLLHRLHHPGPQRVLRQLSGVAARSPSAGVQENRASWQKREAPRQDRLSQAAGWPMGWGSVERANKLVVQAGFKGGGMRWQRPTVNRLLLLGHAVCNRRWQQRWQAGRKQRQQSRHQRPEQPVAL